RTRWRRLFPHLVSDHPARAGDPAYCRHPVHSTRGLRRHDRGGAHHPWWTGLLHRNSTLLGLFERHPGGRPEPRRGDRAISLSGVACRLHPGAAHGLSQGPAMKMRMAPISRTAGFYLALALFCLFAVFPALWMAITAFKRNTDLYDPANNPFLFNLPPTLSHIDFLFTET